MKEDVTFVTIRMPVSLREELVTMAKQETRTLTGQVIQLLREAVYARREK